MKSKMIKPILFKVQTFRINTAADWSRESSKAAGDPTLDNESKTPVVPSTTDNLRHGTPSK